MYKWIMSGIVTLACALGVYLLAAGLPLKPQEEAAPEGGELLKIEAVNWEFNEKEYHVKAGTPYKISFVSKQGNHGVEIPDLNVNLTKDNPSAEITFEAGKTYEIHCSVLCGQGHATMVSTIVVA